MLSRQESRFSPEVQAVGFKGVTTRREGHLLEAPTGRSALDVVTALEPLEERREARRLATWTIAVDGGELDWLVTESGCSLTFGVRHGRVLIQGHATIEAVVVL